jgi:hypothetical protein
VSIAAGSRIVLIAGIRHLLVRYSEGWGIKRAEIITTMGERDDTGSVHPPFERPLRLTLQAQKDRLKILAA